MKYQFNIVKEYSSYCKLERKKFFSIQMVEMAEREIVVISSFFFFHYPTSHPSADLLGYTFRIYLQSDCFLTTSASNILIQAQSFTVAF